MASGGVRFLPTLAPKCLLVSIGLIWIQEAHTIECQLQLAARHRNWASQANSRSLRDVRCLVGNSLATWYDLWSFCACEYRTISFTRTEEYASVSTHCKFNNSWSNGLTICYLSIYIDVYVGLSIYLPVCLPCVFLDLSFPSIRLSTYHSTQINEYKTINLNQPKSIYNPWVNLSIYLPICLLDCPSIYNSIYPSNYQPWYLWAACRFSAKQGCSYMNM